MKRGVARFFYPMGGEHYGRAAVTGKAGREPLEPPCFSNPAPGSVTAGGMRYLKTWSRVRGSTPAVVDSLMTAEAGRKRVKGSSEWGLEGCYK